MSLVSASSHDMDHSSPPSVGLSLESTQLPLMASILHSPSSQEDSSSPTPHHSPAITVSLATYTSSSSTSPPAPPPLQSVANHNKSPAMTGTQCFVCGDTAPRDTVFRTHYGVICCEACKCFFRRTVQMSRDYKCRYGNSCSVGRNAVNMKQVCQACRFSQCVKAGMKLESVKKFPRKHRDDSSSAQRKYQRELKLGKEKGGSHGKAKIKAEESAPLTNGALGGHGSPPKSTHFTTKSPRAPESDGEEVDLEHLKFNVASPESFMYSVLDSSVPQLFNYDSLENIHEKSGGSPPKGSPRSRPGEDLMRSVSNPNILKVISTGGGGDFASASPPELIKAEPSSMIASLIKRGQGGGGGRGGQHQNSLVLPGKRGGPDLQSTIQAKRQRLETALSNITPRQPVASFQAAVQAAAHQSLSQPASLLNSPESVAGAMSAYASQETTPYATPHGTPAHSPLPSPSYHPVHPHTFHPSTHCTSQASPSPTGQVPHTGHMICSTASGFVRSPPTTTTNFSTVNPINLPGFYPQTSSILFPGQPSTILLNPNFRVVPVAGSSLLPLVQFATPFSQQALQLQDSVGQQQSVQRSPFTVVPIPPMRMSQTEDFPTPSLTPIDLDPPCFDEDIRSAPPSGRTSPVNCRTMSLGSSSHLEAELDEVLDSLRRRIRSMFKWAKMGVAGFEDLSPLDQKAILRRTVAELVMLGFARASIAYDDMLLLGSTGKVIRSTNANAGVATVASITLQKLVVPLKVLNIDDNEYSLLKEIVLFNPESPGLRNREVVRQYRRRKHIELMEYTEKNQTWPGRFGDLLCLLTPLFEVSTEVTEQLRLEQFVHEGEARIDALLLMSMINGAEETTESVADS